jgi:hypothetical protein
MKEIRQVDGKQARRADTDLRESSRTVEPPADFGCFRQPVVRGDGANHPPEISPPPARFLAVGSGVAPASLSRATGAFWIDDSNRNSQQEMDLNHPLHVGSLQGRARRGYYLLNPRVYCLFSEDLAVNRIAAAQQVA